MALLPLELLQLILENLHSHHEDLKSCTLISRAWSTSSQARLFNTINIQSRSQCHYLYNHLVRWPHIIPFIHHLSIRISSSPDHKPEPQTLLLLTHLQSLSLYFDWQKITPELRDALITTLQRPTLTSLLIHRSFFDWDGDLPNILRHSVNLKRLSLLGVLCMRQDLGTHEVQQKTRIHDLTISPEYNSSPALSEWIISPQCSLDLSALRSVHITDCDRFNQGLPSCILKLAGSSLTRFSFKSTPRRPFFQGSLAVFSLIN
ncbi:hypothetical protein FPV67DRAFT_1150220 [Lyophyllum atratum]|nr:hypothetical protein FPV67DRAFT_1150220 [Lyophyllum atratum]